MVIKAKDKTRAAQRKGALTNWKKTGRTLIKYLRCDSGTCIHITDLTRKRDISGDDLRRELWVHEEATSPKKKKKSGGCHSDTVMLFHRCLQAVDTRSS
jgi:hypothetical protein